MTTEEEIRIVETTTDRSILNAIAKQYAHSTRSSFEDLRQKLLKTLNRSLGYQRLADPRIRLK